MALPLKDSHALFSDRYNVFRSKHNRPVEPNTTSLNGTLNHHCSLLRVINEPKTHLSSFALSFSPLLAEIQERLFSVSHHLPQVLQHCPKYCLKFCLWVHLLHAYTFFQSRQSTQNLPSPGGVIGWGNRCHTSFPDRLKELLLTTCVRGEKNTCKCFTNIVAILMIFMHLFQSRRGKYSHLNTTTYLCLWTNSCHRFIHSRLCNLEWLVGESTIKWKGNRFPVYRRLRLFHKLFMYSQTFPQCVSKTKEFYWECTAFLCPHSGSCGRQTHTLTHSLYIFCCCMDKFFFFFWASTGLFIKFHY